MTDVPEPKPAPITIAGIEYRGVKYVAIRTGESTYALDVEQARTMALMLLDTIDEVEKSS